LQQHLQQQQYQQQYQQQQLQQQLQLQQLQHQQQQHFFMKHQQQQSALYGAYLPGNNGNNNNNNNNGNNLTMQLPPNVVQQMGNGVFGTNPIHVSLPNAMPMTHYLTASPGTHHVDSHAIKTSKIKLPHTL